MTDAHQQLVDDIRDRLTGKPRPPAAAAAVRPGRLSTVARWAATLPGARHIGTAWVDDPLVFVAVHVDRAGEMVRSVLQAYAASAPDRYDIRGRYVVAVPELLAEVLQWTSCDPEHWAEPCDRPDELADDPAVLAAVADATSRLWQAVGADLDVDEVSPLLAVAADLHARLDDAGFARAVATVDAVDVDLLWDALGDGSAADLLARLAG